MWYLILGLITAFVALTTILAYNKAQSSSFGRFDTGLTILGPLICGLIWPLTLLVFIGYFIYRLALKESYEKLIEWLSNKLFK